MTLVLLVDKFLYCQKLQPATIQSLELNLYGDKCKMLLNVECEYCPERFFSFHYYIRVIATFGPYYTNFFNLHINTDTLINTDKLKVMVEIMCWSGPGGSKKRSRARVSLR